MTMRMSFSGVKSVKDPLKFVVTRLPTSEARLARLSMLAVWGAAQSAEALV